MADDPVASFRPGTRADIPAVSRIANAAAVTDDLGITWSAQWFEHYLADIAGGRTEAVVTIAEIGGQPVGFGLGHWQGDREPDGRVLWVRTRVLEPARRDAIGRGLVERAEDAAVADAARHPVSQMGSVFQTRLSNTERWAIRIFESIGYGPVRWAHRMVRPTLEDPPSIELPAGIEARPVRPEDAIQVLRALEEAMADEPLYNPRTEEQIAAVLTDPRDGQIDVWQVAWEGDEVVGGVLGGIDAEENRALGRLRGYTESIFTRRPWRGRGIARAMIGRNLRVLRDRGMTEAALLVNADGATGALHLYESVGFVPERSEIIYQRQVEE